MEFFQRLWETEINRLQFALDYWYVIAIPMIIVIIVAVVTSINKR